MASREPAAADKGPYIVASVERTLRIVEFLAGRPGLESSAAEIATNLMLPRPTVHRLLANLDRFGYVRQNATRGTYQMGLKFLEYGNLVSRQLSVVTVARPHIHRLMELTGETTHLALLEGRFVVYIDKIEPDRSIRMVSRLGARLPAHCTSLGKAILARLADGEVESLLAGVRLEKPTPHSAGTLREVLARLEPVRRSGYAVDDEEAELGLRCVGAAVTDGQGQTRTAVSLAAPLERMSSARVAELGGLVTQTALDVGRDLGSLAARQGAM